MDREARRAAILASVPASYSPVLHVGIPAVFVVAVLATCIACLRDIQAWELAIAPATFALGLAFEWRLHKDVLHQRRPALGELYVRHELSHHVVFVHDDMRIRSRREMALVLMPTWAIPAAFGLVVPFAVPLYLFGHVNAALVFIATSMIFFLFYEWMHLAYHLPAESFVGRLAFVRVLRALHQKHHDPAHMKRWNFNVTIPLFDWLHGTLWSEAAEARRRAARAKGAGRSRRPSAASLIKGDSQLSDASSTLRGRSSSAPKDDP